MAGGVPAVPNTAEPQMPTMPSGDPNAMWAACPTTNHQPQAVNIYALKSGATVADEQLVSVEGVRRKATNPDGLYSHLVLQVNPNASDYNGTDHSGIWVYLNGTDDSPQENPPAEGAFGCMPEPIRFLTNDTGPATKYSRECRTPCTR